MRHIKQCFNTTLAKFVEQAEHLDNLNQVVKQHLPSSLQDHCRVASFYLGCLILTVTDAVWLTELRYLVPELRDNLRRNAGLYQLSSIKISVATTEVHQPQKKKQKINLSSQARYHIQEIANSCEYPPLKQALHQLGCVSSTTHETE